MYNLLRFIKINHFLLLFLLIEGFSVSLLLKNNGYQANKAIEFSTQYTSQINMIKSNSGIRRLPQ